jgi:serine/threonine-protein kinase
VDCGEVLEHDAAACARCGGRLQPAVLPAIYASRFRLHRQIGAGGMGVVYRATDGNLGRTVALKTLPRVSPEHASRLRREARALAALDHENLVLLLEYDLWRGTPVLVLEYLQGGTLADRLQHGPLPCAEVVDIGVAMTGALAYLHRRGFLHRDIKPSNIGFSSRDRPKLLDFGLVHLVAGARPDAASEATTAVNPVVSLAQSSDPSMRGILIGTPAYLSPEAIRLETPEPSFDLWSLAVTLYEAMTGVHPFRAATASELFARIARAEVVDPRTIRPECPAGFADLMRVALAPLSRHRFRTASSLRSALRQVRSRVMAEPALTGL